MPVGYQMPPWVGQPAEPSANYATGFQIGVRLGAEQAANQYRQQQILLEQQKQAFENQYAQQKQALEVADVIQKQRAIASYQGMVNQGVDPMRALQFVGPSLGVDPSRVAAIEESRMDREAQRQATQQHWVRQMALAGQRERRLETQGEKRLRLAAERMEAEEQKGVKTKAAKAQAQELAQKREKRMATASIERDTELKALRDALNAANSELKAARTTPKGMLTRQSSYDANIKALEANRLEAAKAVDSRLKELRQNYGLEDMEASTSESLPFDRAGNDTLPDISPQRVRMKSPDGKTGTLPADQVDAAVSQGWTRL